MWVNGVRRHNCRVDVRDARPDDAKSIAELNAAAWRIAFRGIVSDDTLANLDEPPDGRREVLENLAENAVQLVAEDDGKVVGWLAAQPCEDDDKDPAKVFEVRACYVAPSSWRNGVGRLLVNAMFQRLASRQWSEIAVWAARDTPASLAFYRSLKFEKDGRSKDHRLADGSVVPVVRLSRRFTDRPAVAKQPWSCS
jgi:L-amino acid N-acyltransferase YncA